MGILDFFLEDVDAGKEFLNRLDPAINDISENDSIRTVDISYFKRKGLADKLIEDIGRLKKGEKMEIEFGHEVIRLK